jgi:hypothetical protein
MKTMNVDVEVVTFPSILGSTEYKRELFFKDMPEEGKIGKKQEWGA